MAKFRIMKLTDPSMHKPYFIQKKHWFGWHNIETMGNNPDFPYVYTTKYFGEEWQAREWMREAYRYKNQIDPIEISRFEA